MSINILKKYKKDTALEMRKKGFSYSRIQYELGVPKSTVSFWLKDFKLSEEQKEKLKNWKTKTIKDAAEKRKEKTRSEIERIKIESARAITKISDRELWLVGIMLYWRERISGNHNYDLKNGIRFSSADECLIKLFLKWLRDIGHIEINEIEFDIFYKAGTEDAEEKLSQAISYWASVTGFSRGLFIHNYRNKVKTKREKGGHNRKNSFLRIRVTGSSMLARQIAGWIEGIKNSLKINDSG